MKAVTLIFISFLCVQIEGYLIKVPTSTTNTRVATGGWVHIQKLLLPLFENVCEESQEPIIVRLNEEFKLDPSNGVYLKPEVIDNFQNLKSTKGLLAKGEIFTEYNPNHLDELKIIYELLYYARDFDTFYKAACWARQNVNCGLFVDAIYLAVLNRRDTEKISIPAPYEILPNYFIRKDFIIKASSLISDVEITVSDYVRNEGNAYILDVNYTTGVYADSDDKLAYFHEDVGLNSYYFLTKLNFLPWLNEVQTNNYGQYLYHTMKQMMARYNLERYSNGLPELEEMDWDYINEPPYDSMLIYSNGNEFDRRMAINVGNNEILTLLKNIESNLPAVVVHLRDGGYNKSDILNHLMEILVTSEKSYLNLAQQFLGENGVSRSPSALEHYMTSARDPMFWRLKKKVVNLVDNALQVLPSYSRNQLYFPGVEIQNIEVKKMMTTFDKFEFDVTNALKLEEKDSKFEIKISQSRLNHKPFSFKISVLSLVAKKALVKIYIGPKLMPGELVKSKNLFMLLDCFDVNLKIGSNILSRSSNEMNNLSEDLLSLPAVHKYVLDAEFGVDVLPVKSVWSQIRFPSRLILPKGTSEGLPLQVFVFIAPYLKATIGGSKTSMDINTDAILSPGYPLDLNIEMQQLFNLPNAMIKDISIVHKSESTPYNKPFNGYNSGGKDKVWQTDDVETDISGGPLSLSARPEFTKKSFDYKSKKNQYNKRPDFANKQSDYKYQVKKEDEIKVDDIDKDKIHIKTINEPEKIDIHEIYINPDLEYSIIQDNDGDTFLYREVTVDKYYDSGSSVKSDNLNVRDFEKDIKIDEHKINDKTEPEVIDIINNIYINPDLEHSTTQSINDDKTVHNGIWLDKHTFADILHSSNTDKIEMNNFKKSIEVKNHEIKETIDPDTMDVINNIYVRPNLEHDMVPIDSDDKIGHNVYKLGEDSVDDVSLKSKSEKIENDDFEKDIEIKYSNIKPHGLLTMPRKKYSNIFHIIWKPIKVDSDK